MTWAEVADRLAAARTYWLGTTTGSGAPHAAPVWGAVTAGTLYLYSERSTVKARNLAIDPRVVIHLESGEDVLIVHGVAEDLGPPAGQARGPAVPAGRGSRVRCGLRAASPVSAGLAPGRLHGLAAPLVFPGRCSSLTRRGGSARSLGWRHDL